MSAKRNRQQPKSPRKKQKTYHHSDEYQPQYSLVTNENHEDEETSLDSDHLHTYEHLKGVEWICSHLIPSKILWSSDTTKLKPNIDNPINIKEGTTSNNVVNTWFVQDPLVSEECCVKDEWEGAIEEAVDIIREANAILIVAGAGMGVDSGLPDYRGPKGFWKAYPKLKSKGLSLEQMSHPAWFKSDSIAAWGFYAHRAHLYHSAIPHEGFEVLLKLVKNKNDNYFIFTSNIDSQFQVAGFDKSKIFEAHGTLSCLQCINEECSLVWQATTDSIPKVDKSSLQAVSPLPLCPECRHLARPNVSMFGDTSSTFKDSRSLKQKKKLLKFLRETCGQFDEASDAHRPSTRLRKKQKYQKLAIIEIGCGVSLHSLRLEVDILIEMTQNSKCVRINPNDCYVKKGGVGIGLGAKESLLKIGERLEII